ncbi:MAG TPA: hypothetical protein VFN35_34605, partial [Ktedonobacteraceae bacterium]|nr:hypothetical protein [Ktedonobacteraceae bacterium]
MDANTPGTLLRRKPLQRLIAMVMLLCCMLGIFAISPFLRSSAVHAAGDVQINAGGAASSP